MASLELPESYSTKDVRKRGSTEAMTTQRHLKPSVSESYGEDEVGAGGLSGFSEPSSPQMVEAMVPPTPLNSVVVTDTVLAHLISINASPQTIRRLLEGAVAEVTNGMEEEQRKPWPKTEPNDI